MVGIYVPTYGRPNSAQRLVDNIAAVTTSDHKVIFIVDREEDYDACAKTGAFVLHNSGAGYSEAIQTAFDHDNSEFFIAANDDFDFQPHWDTKALAYMEDFQEVQVVGISDGAPNCYFATIALVRRSYIEQQGGVIDMPPGRVFYPYKHNFVDTEFYCTAQKRGVFIACPASVVIHRHPDWGHAATDNTYKRAQSTFTDDATTYAERRDIWA